MNSIDGFSSGTIQQKNHAARAAFACCWARCQMESCLQGR